MSERNFEPTPATAYRTILVAFVVAGDTNQQAQETLMRYLPDPAASYLPHVPIDCWWIAEDERYDNSDDDSAVFVPYGMQARASAAVQPLRDKAYGTASTS